MVGLLILVLEKQPRWGPELQRQLFGTGVVISEARSLTDLISSLEQGRANYQAVVVVIDLSVGLHTVLQYFGMRIRGLDSVSTVVIGHSAQTVLEPVLRELGAAAFHSSPLAGGRLAAECKRLLPAEYPGKLERHRNQGRAG